MTAIRHSVDVIKGSTEQLLHATSNLLNLPVHTLHTVFPDIPKPGYVSSQPAETVDGHTLPYPDYTCKRDMQLETLKELQEIQNLAIELKLKLTRLGVYIE